MSVVASDTFTGADTTQISGRAMDVGGSWVLGPTGAATQITISSNQAKGTATTTLLKAGTTSNADGNVTCDYNTQSTSSDSSGLVARVDTGGANTFYRFGKNGTSGFVLQKIVAGVASNLATYTLTVTAPTTYTLKMVLSGTSIMCYVNGTLAINVTDGSITASGNWGFRLNSSFAFIDNFIADNGIAGGTSKAPYYYQMAA